LLSLSLFKQFNTNKKLLFFTKNKNEVVDNINVVNNF